METEPAMPAAVAAPAALASSFRSRQYREKVSSAAHPVPPVPPASGSNELMPMPPPAPPPAAASTAGSERYNARLTRARSSNRLSVMSRSSSRITLDGAPSTSAPAPAHDQPVAPTAGAPSAAAIRRVPPRPMWSSSVRAGRASSTCFMIGSPASGTTRATRRMRLRPHTAAQPLVVCSAR